MRCHFRGAWAGHLPAGRLGGSGFPRGRERLGAVSYTHLLFRESNALADSLADVSHQIRTPLTAITLMLPVVERADDARERKRAVHELESMIERVSWLVTTLLKIAKVDAGAMRVDKREVRAAEVVRRAVAPLATAMDLRDVNLVLDLDESAVFQGDAPWTAEAVENVAKNLSLIHISPRCGRCSPRGQPARRRLGMASDRGRSAIGCFFTWMT